MTQFSLFKWLGSFSPAQITLFTLFNGGKKGTDAFGNVYYEAKARPDVNHTRRWVIYKGAADASAVPPEWHGWLHHQSDELPQSTNTLRRAWQKPYVPNKTGTDAAYHPPGYASDQRADATGDYEAWQPPV